MKRLVLCLCFFSATAYADMRWVSPYVLLYSSNNFQAWQVFGGSVTFSSPTITIGGNFMIFQSSIADSLDLTLHRAPSGFTYWGGDSIGGSLPLAANDTGYLYLSSSQTVTGSPVFHSSITINTIFGLPTSALDINNGSITVRGNNAGISASTYTVNGTSLVGSTWTSFGCDGCVIKFTTGTLAANTSMSISATNLNLTSIVWALCSEQEVVNTAVTSVRLKAFTALPTSMNVFNADALNIKGFSCIAIGRP